MPRLPKPPGTKTQSTSDKYFAAPSCSIFSVVDKFQFHTAIIGNAAMHQRFIETFVGIGEIDIFADDAPHKLHAPDD